MRGQVCTSKDLTRAPIWRGVARRLGEWHAVLPIEMTSKTENGHRSNGFLGDHAHSDPSSQCQLNGHEDADKSRRLRMAAVSRSEPNLWSVMQCWVHALPSSSESERQRNIILRKELVRIIDELGDSLGPGQNGVSVFILFHCRNSQLTGQAGICPLRFALWKRHRTASQRPRSDHRRNRDRQLH